jgi:hypothetical protein
MWIFTTFGFFSVVQKAGEERLTVRARAKADLDALRSQYLPTLSATIEGAGTDYRYRATVPRADLAEAMSRIATDVTYSNFKSEVARRAGHERAKRYGRVWDVMSDLHD